MKNLFLSAILLLLGIFCLIMFMAIPEAEATLIPLQPDVGQSTLYLTFTPPDGNDYYQCHYKVLREYSNIVLLNNSEMSGWWASIYKDLKIMNSDPIEQNHFNTWAAFSGDGVDIVSVQRIYATSTPLPPSVILLGSGIVGLWLMRRRAG